MREIRLETAGRRTNSCGICRHVRHNDGVGADASMVSNVDTPQQTRAGTDVHMSSDAGCASGFPCSDGHLLKNQAVWTDERVRVDDDPVGMR